MQFNLRRFEPSHTAAIADLITSIQQHEFQIPIDIEDQPDLLDIQAFYQHGMGNFWVALSPSHHVIGTIGVLDIGNHQGVIRKMFVHADWRGKTGVATALLTTASFVSKHQGISSLYLGTTEAFKAAHRFYEKHGFEPLPVEDLPPAFPRMSVDTRFYRKIL